MSAYGNYWHPLRPSQIPVQLEPVAHRPAEPVAISPFRCAANWPIARLVAQFPQPNIHSPIGVVVESNSIVVVVAAAGAGDAWPKPADDDDVVVAAAVVVVAAAATDDEHDVYDYVHYLLAYLSRRRHQYPD